MSAPQACARSAEARNTNVAEPKAFFKEAGTTLRWRLGSQTKNMKNMKNMEQK